ncbi:protein DETOXIFICATION 33 [Forsythia ovata]|uniref:Protein DETOXIFICATION 33 n=1 Tax=Forsythia ovata TaxID=205694 RepID=A0ABD1WFS9_9LAMI
MKEIKETQHLLPKMEPKPLEVETHEAHFSSNNGKNLQEKTWEESKKMWEIAAPAILTAVAQFSIGFVTVAFVGHLGEVELAAVSIVQNVLEGFVYWDASFWSVEIAILETESGIFRRGRPWGNFSFH